MTSRRLSPGQVESGGGPQLSAPAVLKPGEVFAERYRISRHLGTGSLCAAYLCLDEKNSEKRVLKVLRPRKSAVGPSFMEDFLFLARSVSHYRHPGIVRIYESGRVESDAYYVMEKLDGPPLRAWFLEHLTFSTRVLPGLAILRKIISVFRTVHERGCYGVLKPENVFLHPARGPVLTDFGVPGFLNSREFEYNSHARRYLPYMAPELRRDWSNLLPQSDVYSLGAMLYEVLVGRPPASPLKILPSEASTMFDIETDEVVLKAMAPSPIDRFDALDALDAAVAKLENALPSPKGRETAAFEVDTGTPESVSPKASDTATIPAAGWSRGSEILPRSEVLPRSEGRGTEAIPAFRETAPETRELASQGTASLAAAKDTSALARESAVLRAAQETTSVPAPGKDSAIMPVAEDAAATGLTAVAHAATRELAAASAASAPGMESIPAAKPSRPEPKTEPVALTPGEGEKKTDAEEEGEPIPSYIWILVGGLAVAVCVLAAMLAIPATR